MEAGAGIAGWGRGCDRNLIRCRTRAAAEQEDNADKSTMT